MSETINDGGPAFPNPGHDNGPGNYRSHPAVGMTLRDYFAAKAMQGMLSTDRFGAASEKTIADWAYEQADAMLRARESK